MSFLKFFAVLQSFFRSIGEALKSFWNNRSERTQKFVKFWLRFRNAYAVYGTIIVLAVWILSDPDHGKLGQFKFSASTVNMILYALRSVIFSSILLITGKAMLDYNEAKFDVLGKKAIQEPLGAAVFAIAVSLKYIAFAIVIAAGVFGA